MVCQVPGCGKDLTGLKDYHQRYRICAVHIRLPQVMKDGRLQRFCQQCGRFHDLAAFDGNRKSCREQLQKHNARRRRRAQLEQSASLAGELAVAVDGNTDVGKVLQGLLSNPFQLQALRVLLGVKTHPALPDPAGFPAEHEAALAAADGGGDAAAAPGASGSDGEGAGGGAAASNPPSYEVARDIMEGAGPYAPGFDSDHRAVKLCLKMFNATPADLPPDLKAQVAGWLAAAPLGLESHIRPGCVMLTAQMTVSESCYDDARRAGMQRLLSNLLAPTSHAFWRTTTYIVQLFDVVAVVSNGALVSAAHFGPAALAAARLPSVTRVSPLCVAVPAGAAAAGAPPVEFEVHGSGLAAADGALVVRSRGRHLPAALLWVEAARGAFHSGARPLLVVEDPQIAAELTKLEGLALRGAIAPRQVDALLLDLSLVLQHVGREAAAAGAEAAAAAGGDARCCAGGGGCSPSHAAGAASCPGLSHHDIVEKARRLLAFACDMGWAGVAAAVLPLAGARCACAADIVAAIHGATAHDGLSLLHRAVRSGSLAMVQGVLAWGARHGYRWDVSEGGPLGVSPLHLAALLDDDAAVLLALLDACGGGAAAAAAGAAPGCCEAGARCCAGDAQRCACCAFTEALTDDGVSPFHLSLQHGHFVVDRVLGALRGPAITRVTELKLQLAGWELLRAATAAGAAAKAAAPGRGGAASGGGGRQTSKLDACLYCQSTLPPLLL
ncbi:MAG: SBP domain-containing protein, partial [Monoraphidium minutum]